jgi:hypothetical protein
MKTVLALALLALLVVLLWYYRPTIELGTRW